MFRIYHALPETALSACFLIPFLLYRGRQTSQSRTTTLLSILFAVYLSAVYTIAGLPSVVYIRFNPHVNFTPFLYMFSDHTASLLNVLLFVPFGFFLPVLWKKYQKLHRTIGAGFLMSLSIEILQIFTYRATDINDLITNTTGTVLGFLSGSLILRKMPECSIHDNKNTLQTILTAVFSIMFLVQPLFIDMMIRII